ncbi:MAG TPA: hypothetical protein VGK94_08555 [Candidatus Polarisedimenticolia bacterium]|jgi:hypothetical protein
MSRGSLACVVGVFSFAVSAAFAGGGWVPEEGDGDFQFGYSRKFADHSWTAEGKTVENGSWHLFRYGYLGGEMGLGHRVSLRYAVLYLDGAEGPPGNYEVNRGMSEAFLGFKYRVHEGTWPMAVALNVRTSILYDQAGTYDRHTYLPDEDDLDGDGDTTEAVLQANDSEWRGLLGEDYGLSFIASRSMFGSGWFNMEVGYTYRTGNLADEMPLYLELGYPLPWDRLVLKGTFNWVDSVGNNSLKRQEDDRFGCSATNCFPDASRQVLGAGFLLSVGSQRLWWVELGYNHWLWGRSTRKYEEPYISLGRRF